MHPVNYFQAACKWAHDLIAQKNFVILTIAETGRGIGNELMQVAIINHSGQLLLDSLIKPICIIDLLAIRFFNLNRFDIAAAPSFDQVWLRIFQTIKGFDLVLFDADFVLRSVNQAAKPYNLSPDLLPHFSSQGSTVLNGRPVHCIMLWHARYCRDWNQSHYAHIHHDRPGHNHTPLSEAEEILEVMLQMGGDWRPESAQPTTETSGEGF